MIQFVFTWTSSPFNTLSNNKPAGIMWGVDCITCKHGMNQRWPALALFLFFSAQNIFCRQKEKKPVTRWQYKKVDQSNTLTLDLLNRHLRLSLFGLYMATNLVKIHPAFCCHQKWHFRCQLKPLSFSLSPPLSVWWFASVLSPLAAASSFPPSLPLVFWGWGWLQLTGQCRPGDN